MSGPHKVECSGTASTMAAYRSLARQCHVSLSDVLSYAERDALGELLVEHRLAGTRLTGGLDGRTAQAILERKRRLWEKTR